MNDEKLIRCFCLRSTGLHSYLDHHHVIDMMICCDDCNDVVNAKCNTTMQLMREWMVNLT